MRDTFSVRQRIVNRPGASLAAALGAGLVLGALARRRLVPPRGRVGAADAKDARSAVWRFARETVVTLALRLASSELRRHGIQPAAARSGHIDNSFRPATQGVARIKP